MAHGLGFEYFWGFMGGETNNWNTPLIENTSPSEKPTGDDKWHLSEAMAEKAISWIGVQKVSAPDKPFFVYWAPGAGHAPHHVAKEWAVNTPHASTTRRRRSPLQPLPYDRALLAEFAPRF